MTFCIQCCPFWSSLILIPLLYPEALPSDGDDGAAGSATAPPPPPPPPPPPQKVVKPVKIVSEIDQGLHAPTKIPKDIKMIQRKRSAYAGGWSRRHVGHGRQRHGGVRAA